MKKCVVLLAAVFAIITTQLKANTVSPSQAENLALNYFKIKVPTAASNPRLAATLYYTQTETDGTVDFYVYNIWPMKGFVIVSADDNAVPVIAWSAESNFANDNNTMGVVDWMKSSATKIHYVISNHILADANIQNLWTSYAQGINPQVTRSATIGPLCTTLWNQSPYYNALCPPANLPSSSRSKAVTGCVATTMAQIMKYWNYPNRGTGSNSYTCFGVNYGTLSADFTRPLNWAAMGNYVNSETDPVDSLMYELGVAVDMNYDSTGSGAFVLISETFGGRIPCSQSVYANNFFYNPNTLQGVQYSSYTTTDWINLMESEINAGRVVQYEGSDPSAGGHTWVMDGYEPNAGGDLLHMNWGWGGQSNGWYSVTNLATPGFNPSQNDAALIGIQPLLPYTVSLTPANPTICQGSAGTTLNVLAPASATYTWTPATGLSCTTCANPVANPSNTTLYRVLVDSAGYTATMSVIVNVAKQVTANFAINPAASCSLPETVAFVNSSSNATAYVWDFGDGTTSSSANPVHAYTANGNYTVALRATNSCGVDSLVQSQAVQITGGAPATTSATICSGQTAIVNASGSNLNWYSDAAGTNLIQTGNMYITPTLNTTTTYYVNSTVSPSPINLGPVNTAIGNSNNDNTNTLRGLNFNSMVSQTLNSVDVVAQGAGARQFILKDASGNIIDSMTVVLNNGAQTVQLGFAVPAGNNSKLVITGPANLAENSNGASYPYTSIDGSLTITGNTDNIAAAYYFFYNWQIQQNICNTPLAPVTAYVLNAGGADFAAKGTGSPAVNFAPNDQTATTYTWSFGDGSTSTQMNPSHTYTSAGSYTVQMVISNGTCADTVTRVINTVQLGVSNIQDVASSLSVYPNPATDAITLNINSTVAASGCVLSISNILGQSVYTNQVKLQNGSNTINVNVASLTTGTYIVSLRNGKEVLNSKFVKE